MRERIPALLSLQDLAINTIVKNIGGYRDLIQKTLSPPTRKIVFDRAMERIKDIGEDKVWAALPYLDQHRTTESFSSEDFAGIFRLQGKILQIPKGRISMEEFLQYLVEFVPNLKQLEIQGPRKTFVDKILYKKIELEPLATDLILKMENLTHISMDDVRIKFSGFLRVCEENQNLQSIQAQNILIDIQPLNSIKNILKKHDSKFDQQEYDLQKFPKKIGIAFKKTSDQEHYREAKLTLPNDFLDQIPSGVTKLEIFSQKPADILSERSCLLRILRREGGSAKSLFLHRIRPELNITFRHIFEHCHELEVLGVHSSCVRHDEQIGSFSKLKILVWLDRENVGTVRLDKIFTAPLLHQIAIHASRFDLGDTESLLSRIRNRKIMTEVTHVWIKYFVDREQVVLNAEAELRELVRELRLLGVSVNLDISDIQH